MAELVDKARPEPSASGTHRLLAVGLADLALAFQFEQIPGGEAGFQMVVFGLSSTGPVVISDTEIALGSTWEIRTSGLWAQQVCERPFEHWSYGLEAFALEIDDPKELLGRGFGQRVPIGWELDFLAAQRPEPVGLGGFSQSGSLEGSLLTGSGEVDVEGRAVRTYFPRRPDSHSDLVTLADSPIPSADGVALPTHAGTWTVSGPPSCG
jgi:hypothetical protein